jgi:periplasmic protein TonB
LNGVWTFVSEHRFLQSFCAVAASSVLVCGTLLLLASTAPWTPPQTDAEPSTPDAARVYAKAKSALENGSAESASDQTEPRFVPQADEVQTAAVGQQLDTREAERLAASSTPLSPETADAGEEDADAGTETAALPDNAVAPEAPPNLATALPSEAETPIAGEKADAAAGQIAALLVTLPPRAIASDRSNAAAEEVAAMLAGLPSVPPPIVASEKIGPATGEVAGLAADLPPPAPDAVASAEPESTSEPVAETAADQAPAPDTIANAEPESTSEDVAETAADQAPAPDTIANAEPESTSEPVAETAADQAPAPDAVANAEPLSTLEEVPEATAVASIPAPLVASVKSEPASEIAEATPPQPEPVANASEAEPAKVAVNAGPPPPLPQRKPEAPPAPQVAMAAPPAELPAPKVVAAPPREKVAAQEEPRQPSAQTGGGLLGLWKPMTLAPADKPAVSPSKAPARLSGGAYASQVWSALARHKPRAGQRGSAAVAFTIGEMGGLRGVQIARSSGNSRLDQLALQTVRNAAPFPAPPSGAVSYTIRIDFQ